MYQKLVQAPAFSAMMQDAGGVNINKSGGGGGAGGAAAFGRAMRGRRAGGVHPTEKVALHPPHHPPHTLLFKPLYPILWI